MTINVQNLEPAEAIRVLIEELQQKGVRESELERVVDLLRAENRRLKNELETMGGGTWKS